MRVVQPKLPQGCVWCGVVLGVVFCIRRGGGVVFLVVRGGRGCALCACGGRVGCGGGRRGGGGGGGGGGGVGWVVAGRGGGGGAFVMSVKNQLCSVATVVVIETHKNDFFAGVVQQL